MPRFTYKYGTYVRQHFTGDQGTKDKKSFGDLTKSLKWITVFVVDAEDTIDEKGKLIPAFRVADIAFKNALHMDPTKRLGEKDENPFFGMGVS